MDKILRKIKPSKEEEKRVERLILPVLADIKNSDIKAIVGGSFAKDTWLSGIHDIDIFVKFNYKKFRGKSDKLADILEKKIKKLKPVRLHGSRDYFQLNRGNITFEIVPILDIKKASQAINITDISPLHALWVKKHKLQDEIRLVKTFAKAQHVYGAETHIMGFSGYVLEILTIYYGSFMNFILGVSKWKDKTVIDPERLLSNPLKELNKAKTESPLILVDPVDKTRNAAAVLSKDRYYKLIDAAKKFLNTPSDKFFELKEETIPKNAISIEIKVSKGKSDVVAGKLYSLFKKIKRQLILKGFKIKKSGFIFKDRAIFWFIFKKEKLPKFKDVKGPPLKMKKHVERFKKKHKKSFIKGNYIYTKEKRMFSDAEKFLKYLIRKFKK